MDQMSERQQRDQHLQENPEDVSERDLCNFFSKLCRSVALDMGVDSPSDHIKLSELIRKQTQKDVEQALTRHSPQRLEQSGMDFAETAWETADELGLDAVGMKQSIRSAYEYDGADKGERIQGVQRDCEKQLIEVYKALRERGYKHNELVY
jgi:hypothetical protein